MKAKTIKAVLRKKVDEWLASIQDKAVRDLASKNTIVTGGCIASMLLKEAVNDFDVYFRDHSTTLAVAKYYLHIFTGTNNCGHGLSVDDQGGRVRIATADGYRGETVGNVEALSNAGEIEDIYDATEQAALTTEDDGKPKYRPVFLSTNAITLTNKVQIVLRFYGDPDAIHENYDFVHCTNYWSSWNDDLVLRQPALESLLARELRYVGSKYPVCSIIRLRKFIKRNWTVNAGQILKMLMQISKLDLTNPLVLEDQLTGVDSAYFCQILEKLRENDPEKINAAYLVEIIDRMF